MHARQTPFRPSASAISLLLVVCVAIGAGAAGWLLIRSGTGEASGPGSVLFLFTRWVAVGVGAWIVAVLGGIIATALVRGGKSLASQRRIFSLGVVAALGVSDLALLISGQISIPLAAWGLAAAAVVGAAAYPVYRTPAAIARNVA